MAMLADSLQLDPEAGNECMVALWYREGKVGQLHGKFASIGRT